MGKTILAAAFASPPVRLHLPRSGLSVLLVYSTAGVCQVSSLACFPYLTRRRRIGTKAWQRFKHGLARVRESLADVYPMWSHNRSSAKRVGTRPALRTATKTIRRFAYKLVQKVAGSEALCSVPATIQLFLRRETSTSQAALDIGSSYFPRLARRHLHPSARPTGRRPCARRIF